MADWRSELAGLYKAKQEKQTVEKDQLAETRKAAAEWFKTVAAPAYAELKEELVKHGRHVDVTSGDEYASITVKHDGLLELGHSLEAVLSPGRAFIKLKGRQTDTREGKQFAWEGQIRSSSQDCVIEKLTKDHLIDKFMEEYKRMQS